MAQPSTIDKLPEPAYEKLIGWLKDRGVTQLEATERVNQFLEEQGYEQRVSKSAVNRYAQTVKAAGDKIRQAAEQAKIWAAEAGASDQGEVGRLVNQMGRTLALELALVLQEGKIDEKRAPRVLRQLKDLGLAMQRLESAATANLKREDDIRRQERERALEKMAELEKSDGPRRVDPETLKMIRQQIYGITDEPGH